MIGAGSAVAAFLAFGVTPVATAPSAHADVLDLVPSRDWQLVIFLIPTNSFVLTAARIVSSDVDPENKAEGVFHSVHRVGCQCAQPVQ